MIPHTGFSPNVDEHTTGVVSDCSMMMPTIRGFKGAPSLVSAGFAALSAACIGAAYILKLDSTNRLFAGTTTKLYEAATPNWTDVSRAGNYNGTADTKWRFAEFGDVSLATNGADTLQKSVGSGAFSDLAGAPKAECIDIVGGFVMLGAYNNGTSTPDGVHWSGFQDYTVWTPGIATQCGNIRLYDTPGKITAVKRLGQDVVIYKRGSMYLGRNNGPPNLWGFYLISSEIGALSQECVVSIETAHLFVGESNIWYYQDGGIPAPIGEELREWFFTDMSNSNSYKIQGTHDKRNSLVYFYYPNSTTAIDRCIVFNYKTKKWSRANRNIEACLEYITAGYTYASAQTAFTTYAGVPSVSYGSNFWTSSSANMAVFDTAHKLQLLTGVSTTSSLTTGALGDDATFTLLKRVQPRFTDDPTSANMTNSYRLTDGASWTTDTNVDMSSGRFDVLREARWHQVTTIFNGDVEVMGNSYLIVPSGSE